MTAMTPRDIARHATIPTAPGPFTVVVDEDDVVLASGWTADVADLLSVVHTTLRPAGSELVDDLPVLDVVEKFFAGDVTAIDAVPVRQRSGPFLTSATTAISSNARNAHRPICRIHGGLITKSPSHEPRRTMARAKTALCGHSSPARRILVMAENG